MVAHPLNEEALEFHLPDWTYVGIVVTLMLTLLAAIYILFGTILAIAYFITFAMAMALWTRTTFVTRKMRRIIPYLVLALVFFLVQNFELWSLDFPTRWTHSIPGADTPPFSMKIFMGFYFFGLIGLGLLAVLFAFFHNHFGNFLTWFIFMHGIVFSLVCIGALISMQPINYFPGVISSLPVLVICASGSRFILKNYRGAK